MTTIDTELSEREKFIYENYPGMTYKAIAEKLGISPTRVGAIRRDAERKVRDMKLREQLREKNRQLVNIEIPRGMCFVIFRGLNALRREIPNRKGADMRMRSKEKIEDPDYELSKKVEALIQDQIR